eukprot:6260171-Amphidinium_carterae.1
MAQQQATLAVGADGEWAPSLVMSLEADEEDIARSLSNTDEQTNVLLAAELSMLWQRKITLRARMSPCTSRIDSNYGLGSL